MDIVSLDQTATAFEALGIPLPTEFERVRTVLTTALGTATNTPAQDVLDAFAAGATPEALAKKVMAAALDLTARQSAHQIIRDLQHPLGKHAAKAVRDDGDQLIDALRVRFDQAATAMRAAADLFPAHSTAEDILRLGPDAATAWGQLAEARTTLDQIHAARMRMFGHGVPAELSHRVLMYVADVRDPMSLSHAEDAFITPDHLAGPGGRWHALAAAGFTLRLNTAAEIAELAAGVQTEHERQAAERAAAKNRMTPEQQAGADKELRMRAQITATARRRAR